MGKADTSNSGFLDNLARNTGDGEADLHIFEVSDIEPFFVELRPADAATHSRLLAAGIVNGDADGFYEFGNLPGGLASLDLDNVPNAGGSQGTLRIGSGTARFVAQTGQASPFGEYWRQIDLGAFPTTPASAVLPGETWNFQAWHRDLNPMPTSNFTEGLSVVFR